MGSNTTSAMPPAPPSESQILSSYLLHPSPLPTILPYSTYLGLVPSSLVNKQHPELKRVYRDLQFQRDVTVDDVRRRIEDECRRSTGLVGRLTRQVRREEQTRRESRKRKRDGPPEDGDVASDDEKEITLDTALHGVPGGTLPKPPAHHTFATLLAAITSATQSLDAEIAALDSDIAALHADCEEKVGNLSDLRYGRFASSARASADTTTASGTGGIEEEILAAIQELTTKLER